MNKDEARQILKSMQVLVGCQDIDGDPREEFQDKVEALRNVAWPENVIPSGDIQKLRLKVHNRGIPPTKFLQELITWGKSAPDEIFTPNTRIDIYSSVKKELGPYGDTLHRKAVMLEVLRVLGGFESSWDWTEGRDVTNDNVDRPENEEAGIFQTSYDSIAFSTELRDCMARYGVRSAQDFIRVSKSNHTFAMEYTARLLRFTINHHGPIKRSEIDQWLSRAAVDEFKKLIA